MKLHELLEKRAAKLGRMRAMMTALETRGGDFTDGETAEYSALESEIRALNAQIKRAEDFAGLERTASATPVSGTPDFDQACADYSLVRALAHASGLNVDAGREINVSQEIARRSGRTPQGIFAPHSVTRIPRPGVEQRVMQTGGAGAGLTFTEHRPQDYIDALRANLVTVQLGATVLSGLQGNVTIPKNDSAVPAEWIAENGSLTGGDGDFNAVTLGPKTVGSLTEYTRTLLLQSSPDIENLVRADFGANLAVALDAAALVGGGANMPSGIIDRLTDASALGTLSGPTRSQVLGLIASVELANAATGRLGWAVNPNAVRTLRSTPNVVFGSPPQQDGSAGFIMDGPNDLLGYPALSTTSLPDSLGSPAPGSAIFGNWADLLIGYWSGIDILANPYGSTQYAKGNVQVRALLTADVAVRHIESFAAAIDVPAAS
jgi:HK97 family phage major capsid protein